MKQVFSRFLILAIASMIGIVAIAACTNSEKTMENKTAPENKATENKSAENELAGERLRQGESDAGKDNATIKALQGSNEKLRQQTIDEVLRQPNDYNPVVLCVLSQKLYEQEKRDEASFWFYTCQLRARIDSKISTDLSTETAVTRINQMFGPNINKHAFQDLNNLEKIVDKVVEFVRSNEENYDRAWIYKSGIDALRSAMEKKEAGNPLKPKVDWAAIKKNTIDNYYKDFLEAKKKAAAMKKPESSPN